MEEILQKEVEMMSGNNASTGQQQKSVAQAPSEPLATTPSQDLQEEQPNKQAQSVTGEDLQDAFDMVSLVGSIAGTLGLSVLAIFLADYAGLDAKAHMGFPEDPLAVASQCLQWSIPGTVLSYLVWSAALRSDSPLGDNARRDVKNQQDILFELSPSQIVLFTLALEVASGLISRGAGLAASTAFFAGIPTPQVQDPFLLLEAGSQGPNMMVHLPDIWLWPVIALGSGALDAFFYQSAMQGGFREPTRENMEEQALTQLFSIISINQFYNLPEWVFTGDYPSKAQEAAKGVDVRPSAMRALPPEAEGEDAEQKDSASKDEAINAIVEQVGKAVVSNPAGMGIETYAGLMSEDPAIRTFFSKVPTEDILDFAAEFSEQHRLMSPTKLYGSLGFLARGSFLAAETILTGSLWASVITGTCLSVAETFAIKEYLADEK